MTMNAQSILERLEHDFGKAQLITTLTGLTIPQLTTRIEVKGPRDSAWRPIATVRFAYTDEPVFVPFTNAGHDDIRRAGWLFEPEQVIR